MAKSKKVEPAKEVKKVSKVVEDKVVKPINMNERGYVSVKGTGKSKFMKKDVEYFCGKDLAEILVKKGSAVY